jgi:hypothetical protein
MNPATIRKITRYFGNQWDKRVAIIKAKAEWALGKLGSRISPGPFDSLDAISKIRKGLSLFKRNLRL